MPVRKSTLLEPHWILCPGICGDGYQLSGASGTPPLSSATALALCRTPTSPNQIGILTSSSPETHQWYTSSGGHRSRLRRRRILGPVPLWLDLSSKRLQCTLGGTLSRSLTGARGSVPVFRRALSTFRDGGRLRWYCVLFCRHSGPPLGDLGCIKWQFHLVEPGKAPSMMVAPETFGVTI